MAMPTYADGRLILPGDWVKVLTPSWGGIWHQGIVRRVIPSLYGTFYIEIIHNVKNGGVVVSPLEDFSNGGTVFFVRRPSSAQHVSLVLATADANRGKPYSAFSQNCEHFCWFCYTWEPKSETVQAFAVAAIVAGAFLVFRSDSD
jgi:hypothetical protein